jgi:hypothetical protein
MATRARPPPMTRSLRRCAAASWPRAWGTSARRWPARCVPGSRPQGLRVARARAGPARAQAWFRCLPTWHRRTRRARARLSQAPGRGRRGQHCGVRSQRRGRTTWSRCSAATGATAPRAAWCSQVCREGWQRGALRQHLMLTLSIGCYGVGPTLMPADSRTGLVQLLFSVLSPCSWALSCRCQSYSRDAGCHAAPCNTGVDPALPRTA